MQILIAKRGKLGATVTEVDGRTLTTEQATRLVSLVHEHGLIVVKNQNLTAREYVALGRKLGPLDVYLQENYHHPEFPEIFVSSNEVVDGKAVGVARTGNYWHTDGAFLPRPYPLTMLYPRRLPVAKRGTLFVHMGEVYERLPSELRRAAAGTIALHDCKWRYKVGPRDNGCAIAEILETIEMQCPASPHPTVITHPVTGRELLYVSPGFTTKILGLSHEESDRLLQALFAFATQPENVHNHEYELGDVILWDNRQLMHRSGAVPAGEVSTIYRLNPNDQQPFYAAQEQP